MKEDINLYVHVWVCACVCYCVAYLCSPIMLLEPL